MIDYNKFYAFGYLDKHSIDFLVFNHEKLLNSLLTFIAVTDETIAIYGQEYFDYLLEGMLIQLTALSNEIYKRLKTIKEK